MKKPISSIKRVEELEAEAVVLRREIQEHEASFDLRWKADMRAIKRWQRAHPDRENTRPDHADLCVWLLERLEESGDREAEPVCITQTSASAVSAALLSIASRLDGIALLGSPMAARDASSLRAAARLLDPSVPANEGHAANPDAPEVKK